MFPEKEKKTRIVNPNGGRGRESEHPRFLVTDKPNELACQFLYFNSKFYNNM